MKFSKIATTFLLCLTISQAGAETKPLKALLIAGGCCHDYKGQTKVLSEGIQARANVQVDVYWTDDGSTNPPLPLYDDPDWAKGYDIIIHDECAAENADLGTMARILAAHKTIPAVHLHCAMHSFRNGTDQWFKHLGLASNSHGPQEPIEISFVDREHPITKPLDDWTTTKEELYNNIDMFDAHPLAMGKQMVNGKAVTSVVAWTNEKQGARSFSTTIGHNTSTVADERYLELVTRGLLWACGKLEPAYLTPFTGNNQVTFISKEAQAAAEMKKQLAAAPGEATLVAITARAPRKGTPAGTRSTATATRAGAPAMRRSRSGSGSNSSRRKTSTASRSSGRATTMLTATRSRPRRRAVTSGQFSSTPAPTRSPATARTNLMPRG